MRYLLLLCCLFSCLNAADCQASKSRREQLLCERLSTRKVAKAVKTVKKSSSSSPVKTTKTVTVPTPPSKLITTLDSPIQSEITTPHIDPNDQLIGGETTSSTTSQNTSIYAIH